MTNYKIINPIISKDLGVKTEVKADNALDSVEEFWKSLNKKIQWVLPSSVFGVSVQNISSGDVSHFLIKEPYSQVKEKKNEHTAEISYEIEDITSQVSRDDESNLLEKTSNSNISRYNPSRKRYSSSIDDDDIRAEVRDVITDNYVEGIPEYTYNVPPKIFNIGPPIFYYPSVYKFKVFSPPVFYMKTSPSFNVLIN
jgi:hypothetical protein